MADCLISGVLVSLSFLEDEIVLSHKGESQPDTTHNVTGVAVFLNGHAVDLANLQATAQGISNPGRIIDMRFSILNLMLWITAVAMALGLWRVPLPDEGGSGAIYVLLYINVGIAFLVSLREWDSANWGSPLVILPLLSLMFGWFMAATFWLVHCSKWLVS